MNEFKNLHPNVQNQLSMVRRELKGRSKNDLVRIIQAMMVEISKKDMDTGKLRAELSKAEEFIKENEEAFQAFLNAKPEPDIKPAEAIPDEPA